MKAGDVVLWKHEGAPRGQPVVLVRPNAYDVIDGWGVRLVNRTTLEPVSNRLYLAMADELDPDGGAALQALPPSERERCLTEGHDVDQIDTWPPE